MLTSLLFPGFFCSLSLFFIQLTAKIDRKISNPGIPEGNEDGTPGSDEEAKGGPVREEARSTNGYPKNTQLKAIAKAIYKQYVHLVYVLPVMSFERYIKSILP